MKTFNILFFVLSITVMYGQNKVPKDTYSDWLYVQSDKPVQERFKLINEDGDFGIFQIQFQLDTQDQTHCNKPQCLGYIMAFGVPDESGQNLIYSHYKVMNTMSETYTLPENVRIKLNFSDGSKRFLTDKGFFYTSNDGDSPQQAYVFSNCVDNIISNYPQHRCSEFDETKAITIEK
ncbi:hypothetical protein [Chryseobacterium nematophagum]|nr:hypothetical protein [Chryseobacterium nematophagum]